VSPQATLPVHFCFGYLPGVTSVLKQVGFFLFFLQKNEVVHPSHTIDENNNKSIALTEELTPQSWQDKIG
jgi:hypothetical protein